jgi:hypothetical protein
MRNVLIPLNSKSSPMLRRASGVKLGDTYQFPSDSNLNISKHGISTRNARPGRRLVVAMSHGEKTRDRGEIALKSR